MTGIMTHIVSLSVGASGPDDHAATFQDISELSRSLATTHSYVNVTSQLAGYEDADEEDADCSREHVSHTERTLVHVRRVMIEHGVTPESVDDLINELHNAGIVFRERFSE